MDKNANEDLRDTLSNDGDYTSIKHGLNVESGKTSNLHIKIQNEYAQNTTPYNLNHTEEEFEIYNETNENIEDMVQIQQPHNKS